jgi:hypothetical protein
MNEQSFEATYAQMSDGELGRVLRDKRELVPLAVSALDREVQRRNLNPSQLRKLKPKEHRQTVASHAIGPFLREDRVRKIEILENPRRLARGFDGIEFPPRRNA